VCWVCAVGAAGREGGGVSEGPSASELRARVEETLLSERGFADGEGLAGPTGDIASPELAPVSSRSESDVWRGVYPGMCRDPELCRGRGSCPRDYSCSE
jgi:hypothetical protein